MSPNDSGNEVVVVVPLAGPPPFEAAAPRPAVSAGAGCDGGGGVEGAVEAADAVGVVAGVWPRPAGAVVEVVPAAAAGGLPAVGGAVLAPWSAGVDGPEGAGVGACVLDTDGPYR
jgi:hypothetical protein